MFGPTIKRPAEAVCIPNITGSNPYTQARGANFIVIPSWQMAALRVARAITTTAHGTPVR
jgi:hypothetical protein